MELVIDQHKGMSVLIAPEKLPSYLYQIIQNFELSRILGRLVKRDGYKNILTTGLTNMRGMYEFTDRGGTRRLLLSDADFTYLKESVYSGGYGAIAAIANDERWESSHNGTIYPVLFNNELRTGQGIAGADDDYYPFLYAYRDAVTRFPNSDVPLALSAGTYVDNQFNNSRLGAFLKYDDLSTGGMGESAESKVADIGLAKGRYIIYASPVFDGYQRGFPDLTVQGYPPLSGLIQNASESIEQPYDYGSLQYVLNIYPAVAESYKRITAIDLFIADAGVFGQSDLEIYPAYFLERVPLDDDGAVILEKTGKLETANPPTYIEFDDDFDTWETFPLTGFYGRFEASTSYEVLLGTRTENSTKVRYAISGMDNADSGESVVVKVFSRWTYLAGSGSYLFKVVYDDYYRKLGSEMFTYLNIPTGDLGISESMKYKYAALSNKRYFICGLSEGPYGYYSVVGSPDIIPQQNIIRFKHEPTGCCSIGNDFIVFSANGAERYAIFDNVNAEKDDEFSNIGLTGQQALCKVSDEEVYGFDLRGPWYLRMREHRFIGQHLKEWWIENLTDAQKGACVVSYNRLKDWIIYSFPTFSGTVNGVTYANGICFVYDREASNYFGVESWWILDTDVPIYFNSISVDDDLHLLTGSTTKIVDWNEPDIANQDETVNGVLRFKVIQNNILGKRVYFQKMFMDYDLYSDELQMYAIPDGGSWVALNPTTDKEIILKRVCKTLSIHLISNWDDGTDRVSYSSFMLVFQPKRV